VVELVPAGPLRGALSSAQRLTDQLRGTARGRRQLTAVIVVIGLLLIGTGWWLGFGRYTEAPALIQLTRANAAAEAARLGFQIEFGTGRYAEDVPIDTVLAQTPAAGGRIVKGGTVTVFLSLGPERYQVPEVAGQAVDFATAQLVKSRFVVQTEDGYSDTLPANFVVGTKPPAGTSLAPNETVTLIVAKGGYPVHVPGIVGKQRQEAESQLKAAGFDVEVQEKDDQTQKRDLVLDQNPQAGQGYPSAKGVKVVIIVAKGPPGVPMPRVLDAGCNDARNALAGMGLQVDVQGNDIEKQFGRVRAQNPQPDQPVQPGQQVQIQCQLF
jgi:serine/threonine-protein kinase